MRKISQRAPLITNVRLPKNHHPAVKEYEKKTLLAEFFFEDKNTFLFSNSRLTSFPVILEASKQLWKHSSLSGSCFHSLVFDLS